MLVSAVVETYGINHLTWRGLAELPLPWRLFAAHALSFALSRR